MDRIFVLIHKHDCRLGAVSQQRISFIVMLQSLADFMHLQIFSIFLNTSDVNSSLDIASSGGQTKATASHNNADNTKRESSGEEVGRFVEDIGMKFSLERHGSDTIKSIKNT
jgi:hypothetical protein